MVRKVSYFHYVINDPNEYTIGGNMIQLEPGTVLEKEYKGNTIKVKVLKDGTFSFNGKNYEDRGSLMKAILKGKTGQFTNFFKLNLNGEDKPKKKSKKIVEDVSSSESIDNMEFVEALSNYIKGLVNSEVNRILTSKFGGNS